MIEAALAWLRLVAKMGLVTMNQVMRKNLALDPHDTTWVVQRNETLTAQGLQEVRCRLSL
jgi:hypothetical protein